MIGGVICNELRFKDNQICHSSRPSFLFQLSVKALVIPTVSQA